VSAPKRAGLVLASLIAVAAVANLNLAVANVALPSIGQAFDAGQTALDLVAVGYSLGLAASVLYLGADIRSGGLIRPELDNRQVHCVRP
jgi:MFS transporter, DHA2 family, multidrug resistance protein